jgi:hypothetical protein
MTRPRTHEEWARDQISGLVGDYVALESIVARASGHGPGGNGTGLPVREDVVDLQREIERAALRLRYRAAVLLGRKVPRIPLSRRFYLPCPYCGANSLWVEPDGWYVLCGNQGCRDAEGRRHEWHDWAELEHLHDMVAALIAEAIDNPTSPEPHQQEQTA